MRSLIQKMRIGKNRIGRRILGDARAGRISSLSKSRRRSSFPKRFKLILSVLAVSGVVSCGLFSTREPASPLDTTPSSDLALSSDEALTQLSAAFSLHDPNLYLSVIADSFRYESTPQAYASGPAYFADWSFNQERNFIRNLLAFSMIPADSLAELTLETIQQQEGADSTVTYQGYRLEVHTIRNDLPDVYEGVALMVIGRGVDGGWRIRRWLDDASGDSPTMSQLRAGL